MDQNRRLPSGALDFTLPGQALSCPQRSGTGMFAKVVGGVTAVAVFFIYFEVIGNQPVIETVLGFALAAAAGGYAWWETDRRLRQRDHRP
jgi:hypothetical protein